MLEWNGRYSVQVKEIDDQHRRLIGYINELEAALLEDSRESITPIMDGLIAYTIDHFATEEAYFSLFDYARTREHVSQHSQMVNELKGFVMDFNQNPDFDKARLLDYLNRWLVEHILGADKAYIACFTENGLS